MLRLTSHGVARFLTCQSLSLLPFHLLNNRELLIAQYLRSQQWNFDLAMLYVCMYVCLWLSPANMPDTLISNACNYQLFACIAEIHMPMACSKAITTVITVIMYYIVRVYVCIYLYIYMQIFVINSHFVWNEFQFHLAIFSSPLRHWNTCDLCYIYLHSASPYSIHQFSHIYSCLLLYYFNILHTFSKLLTWHLSLQIDLCINLMT